MSEKEINNLDPNDIGLQAIFGERWHDEIAQNRKMAQTIREATNPTSTAKVAQKPDSKPVEEQWEPAKAEPNFYDKLWNSAKWACLYGGLSFLIFYWEQAGLMAESIAVPAMCVCTALVGWSIGKHAKRGNR